MATQVTLNSGSVDSAGSLALKTNGTTTAVTINSSQGVEFNAGTAALPSITTTGDTNTGIFFPAADTIAFAEGGAEAMRITSAGDVGIGTGSPSSFGGYTTTSIGGTNKGLLTIRSTGTTDAGFVYYNGTNFQIESQTGFPLAFSSASAQPIKFLNLSTELARIESSGNLQFNSGYGSVATGYGCRAWVNFNGTGTVAIRGSGNVSSITDNGTGDYTVNFTTALPDTNYAALCTGGVVFDQGSTYGFAPRVTAISNGASTKTTTQLRVLSRRDADYDLGEATVSVFR